METVSRPVGGLPLVAEANHAKFHSSNKTCDFVVCCFSRHFEAFSSKFTVLIQMTS
jgi:hypothetical protein